jgi:hypothetical protein
MICNNPTFSKFGCVSRIRKKKLPFDVIAYFLGILLTYFSKYTSRLENATAVTFFNTHVDVEEAFLPYDQCQRFAISVCIIQSASYKENLVQYKTREKLAKREYSKNVERLFPSLSTGNLRQLGLWQAFTRLEMLLKDITDTYPGFKTIHDYLSIVSAMLNAVTVDSDANTKSAIDIINYWFNNNRHQNHGLAPPSLSSLNKFLKYQPKR